MKKVLFIMFFLTLGVTLAQDKGNLKGLKLGLHGGIPIGDSKNNFSSNFGVDVTFMHFFSDGFGIGLTSGYSFYKYKKDDNVQVFSGLNDIDINSIPIAISLQLPLYDNFFVGTDMGFAMFLNSEWTKGGAIIQPKIGYQREKFEIYGAYKKITQSGSPLNFSTINLGLNYKF